MTSTVTKIDWDAVKTRLASVTNDPSVIAGFERTRESGEIGEALANWVIKTDAFVELAHLRPRRTHDE